MPSSHRLVLMVHVRSWSPARYFVSRTVIAVFGVFALLWGMRMRLAQPTSAMKAPEREGQIEAGEQPVAA